LPEASDTWWTIKDSDDAETISNLVSKDLVNYGLPLFDSITDYISLAAFFTSRSDHFHAALSYHLAGFKDQASREMSAAYINGHANFQKLVHRIATKNAIPYLSKS
jgi:hypothetical protein